jgi:hypothetical protein
VQPYPEDARRPALLWLPSPSSSNPSDTVTDRVEWSYAELWARATAAAAHLREVIAPLSNNNNNNAPPPPSLSPLLSPEHRAHTVGVMVEEGPGMAVAELAVRMDTTFHHVVLQSKHIQFMTAGMFLHVTDLSPGVTTLPGGDAGGGGGGTLGSGGPPRAAAVGGLYSI